MKYNDLIKYFLLEGSDDIPTRLKQNTFSASLPNGKDISGNVYDLIKFADKYETVKVSGKEFDKLKDIGLYSGDYDDEHLTVKYKGKFVPYKSLPKDEQEKINDKEEKIIMKSDLSYPIIVSGDKNKPHTILDGNHRIAKAVKTKTDNILVKYIPLDDLKNFK